MTFRRVDISDAFGIHQRWIYQGLQDLLPQLLHDGVLDASGFRLHHNILVMAFSWVNLFYIEEVRGAVASTLDRFVAGFVRHDLS